METSLFRTLVERLRPHVTLGKSRRETLAMLTQGFVSARTVNLANVACERGTLEVASASASASSYRRFQRFFQQVRLPQDWAAPMVAA